MDAMKMLKYLLTGLTGFAAVIAVAYFMYGNGTGLFTALPDSVTDFLMAHAWMQHAALGLVIVFLAANLFVTAAIKRQEAEIRA
jgi:hypothetical protein